jgi:16S rRNA (cytosine967-C5)-methyltransferase
MDLGGMKALVTLDGKEPPTESSRFSSDVVSLTEEVYGRDTQTVLEALRKPVSTYYVRCNTIKTSPEELIRRLKDKGLRVSQHPSLPEALRIEVNGPFDISSTDKKIVVDKHTAESVLQGANVYAPGVVNCEPVHFGEFVTVISELGDLLATGRAAMSSNDILTFRKGLAVNVEKRRYNSPQVRDLPEYSEGLLYPQSLAAMATSRTLDPQANETILDMNCAPGGKLSHISQLMHNSGRIVGLDRNREKIATTRERIAVLGCSNATISIQDSRYADVDLATLRPDRVMVDPPCSALGLRPKIYDLSTKRRVDDLAEYQKQFVKTASRVVKPQGVVVYSVCTYTANECEGVVKFAQRECGLHLVEQTPLVASWDIQKENHLFQRFHPVRDEIGYFIAKFER